MAATRKATKTRPVAPQCAEAAGISSEAVLDATGRDWDAWFGELDGAGGIDLDHRALVALVAPRLERSAWWAQMIAVAYEQARGLRVKHQTADGFKVGGSKTVAVPVARLYRAFADRATRKRWLDEDIVIRKSTPDKSVRITWPDGTSVDVNLVAKGEAKSSVQVEHAKLADAKDAAERKAFWKEALARLAASLEGR